MSDCERLGHIAAVKMTHRPRDRFRRRWWVRCWNCDLRLGPYERRDEAERRAARATRAPGHRSKGLE